MSIHSPGLPSDRVDTAARLRPFAQVDRSRPSRILHTARLPRRYFVALASAPAMDVSVWFALLVRCRHADRRVDGGLVRNQLVVELAPQLVGGLGLRARGAPPAGRQRAIYSTQPDLALLLSDSAQRTVVNSIESLSNRWHSCPTVRSCCLPVLLGGGGDHTQQPQAADATASVPEGAETHTILCCRTLCTSACAHCERMSAAVPGRLSSAELRSAYYRPAWSGTAGEENVQRVAVQRGQHRAGWSHHARGMPSEPSSAALDSYSAPLRFRRPAVVRCGPL
jgi:hypothetical protein